jgi:hypothetical protein
LRQGVGNAAGVNVDEGYARAQAPRQYGTLFGGREGGDDDIPGDKPRGYDTVDKPRGYDTGDKPRGSDTVGLYRSAGARPRRLAGDEGGQGAGEEVEVAVAVRCDWAEAVVIPAGGVVSDVRADVFQLAMRGDEIVVEAVQPEVRADVGTLAGFEEREILTGG